MEAPVSSSRPKDGKQGVLQSPYFITNQPWINRVGSGRTGGEGSITENRLCFSGIGHSGEVENYHAVYEESHIMLLFRNPDIFNDPDSFQPSRWETPTRDMLDAFNPFALGKQNCVGQSLANAELFAIVARICSEFELSVESEGSVGFFLTLKPMGARLRARKV